jgi:hypothetical protein
VDDHPGRIQRAAQARSASRGELLYRALAEVAGVVTCPDCFTRAREGGARSLHGKRWRFPGEPLVACQFVHGRQVTKLYLGQV